MLSLFSTKKHCGLCNRSPAIDILCHVCEVPATRCEPCGDERWCRLVKCWVCADCGSTCPICGDGMCALCPDAKCGKCGTCKFCCDLMFCEDSVTFTCQKCPASSLKPKYKYYDPWSKKEVKKLRKLVGKGKSISKIAKKLQRTEDAVRNKLHRIKRQEQYPDRAKPERADYSWMPGVLVEAINLGHNTQLAMKKYIRLHYGWKINNDDLDYEGRIRWETNVGKVLWGYECFERSEKIPSKSSHRKMIQSYRVVGLEDLQKKWDKFKASYPRRKRNKAFSKAMNLVKAFRK